MAALPRRVRWSPAVWPQWSMLRYVLHTLRYVFASLVGLTGLGTIGYSTIAHYGVFDAFYMTVITLSTVGYREVRPLSSAGRGFTIGLLAAGFATLVYAVTTLTNVFTSGEALEQLKKTRGKAVRAKLVDHVIVVGFGRVGQAVAHSVRELGLPCLVIDKDPEREPAIVQAGHAAIIGDATNEDDLREAGIDRARALVAAAELDEINLIVTLTARALRSDLRIVARVNDPAWRDRMLRAGANAAESPYITYGVTLASAVSSEKVFDLHRLPLLGFDTEEIEVGPASPLIGAGLTAIGDAHPGVFVVGLRRDQQFQRWHEIDGPILAGDVLVVLGDADSLVHLAARSGTSR